MNIDFNYLLSKVNEISHPKWDDSKDAIIWILSSFIDKSLMEELIFKPINLLKKELKYIKKYIFCSKQILYFEEIINNYSTKEICTLEELVSISKKIDDLTINIDNLYEEVKKNNDILYLDNNLDEYMEVLDLEKTIKLSKLTKEELKKLNRENESSDSLKSLEKTLVLKKPITDYVELLDLEKTMQFSKLTKEELKKLDISNEASDVFKDLEETKLTNQLNINENDIEIISDLEKTLKLSKLTKEELKKLDISNETIDVLKDLEKTLVLKKPITDYIEVLDLEKTIKMPKVKKDFKKLDINDKSIEILSDLEKAIILDKKLENDEIEILDYLDKTIKIPKLTKKELKKLDINDETIEVLDFLDKTRKIPRIKNAEINKKDINSLKNLEVTVKINRYKITDSILKKLARRKKIRKQAFISILVILCITFFISSYRIIAWYRSNASLREEIEQITSKVEIKEKDENNNIIINETDKYLNETFLDVDFNELKKTNQDTVGWIYVPGTNINYPFVKTTDNKYYLEHSFMGNYNEAGWVFMDYRNKTDVLDFNTIIYAHGRLDKTMFGSLRDTLEEQWYSNEDNHYIKLAMLSNNTLWEVFSVYKIDTETYYLHNSFDSYESHKKFLDTIKKRSIYDFGVNVTTDDKVLTLSTCYDNFKKVVVHAKMIKQYNK